MASKMIQKYSKSSEKKKKTMSDEEYIETWKMKKLIQRLRDCRGNGTSMISLIIPPNTQISQINKLLTEEYGTATNIKSRVNRLSVLDAITSTQQRLKLYTKIPPNGLLLFCGTILTPEGKEKRVTIDFEPFRPINTSLYMCDNRFHVEGLSELTQDTECFGFIIVNGDSCLFGTLKGNTREVLYSFTVELPKKHGRGGQSALRFARLRMEARHNYLRKVAELATQYFITDDQCNVRGLVLGGSADFKTDLSKSDMFDARLQNKVLVIVDVAYGGDSGFHQAIHLASESLGNVRYVREKKLILQFFTEIDIDSGKVCFTVSDTIRALELGAVDTLIVWEQSPNMIHDNVPFVEWIAEHYKEFGAKLEFVTDCSQEAHQFVRGFGGIGAILRWKVDFDDFQED